MVEYLENAVKYMKINIYNLTIFKNPVLLYWCNLIGFHFHKQITYYCCCFINSGSILLFKIIYTAFFFLENCFPLYWERTFSLSHAWTARFLM